MTNVIELRTTDQAGDQHPQPAQDSFYDWFFAALQRAVTELAAPGPARPESAMFAYPKEAPAWPLAPARLTA